MSSTRHRLVALVALVAVCAPAAVTASPEHMAGMLNMNARLGLIHGGAADLLIECNDPRADDGASRAIRRQPFPGLGQVSAVYCAGIVSGARSGCAGANTRLVAYRTRLTIAGKGDVDVLVPDGPCVSGDLWLNPGVQTFNVTGGTGVYAGAAGSGTLVRSLGALTENGRTGTETWTGTLEVPGLEFDLTPPALTGATSKSVKAKKGAKSARVTFQVTAQDDRDGSVPVTCYPKSGFRFPLGRTRVSCSATDTSANTASATFTVTVTRTR
jgi:hypothetical protein